MEKSPLTSVEGAGDGRAETVAISSDATDTNPGKPIPDTVMISPGAALLGSTVTLAAGTV
jgi:hypothetical protein